MGNDKEFLGREPVGKLLARLAVPTVLAQIVNLLYNMVDRIYIGQYDPSGLAFTGVGVCMPVIMMVSAFSALVGFGGAPRASILMGAQDYTRAEKTLGNCFALLLGIGAVLTVLLAFFSRSILLAFGASADTIEPAMDYMSIYLVGTLFVQISMGMNSFISGQGFAKESMMRTLVGAVLNIILDPVFIFGLKMGVRGAALATIISQAVAALWVVAFLSGKRTHLKLRLPNFKIEWGVIAPCLALGVSPFIMMITESAISVCFNTSLRSYGGDIAVGAMTILTTLSQFCMMPLQGLTQGAQPITSFNFGARRPERVRQSFKYLLISCLVYAAAVWALIMLAPEPLVRMFNRGNPELIEYTVWALRIFCAVLLLMGAQLACQQTLIALGNAKTSLFLAVLRKIILLIPLIYILPLFFPDPAGKAFAVFLAEPVADFIAVTTTVTVFRSQFKKSLAALE